MTKKDGVAEIAGVSLLNPICSQRRTRLAFTTLLPDARNVRACMNLRKYAMSQDETYKQRAAFQSRAADIGERVTSIQT